MIVLKSRMNNLKKRIMKILDQIMRWDFGKSEPETVNREFGMTLAEYQGRAHQTSLPINTLLLTPNQVYAGLGLPNEAGEVGGLIKKAIRGDYGYDPADDEKFREKLAGEIGDCLWYVSEVARQFGFQLENIAKGNLEKLADRKSRGVLRGSGGDR